jgi:hypothetical protein
MVSVLGLGTVDHRSSSGLGGPILKLWEPSMVSSDQYVHPWLGALFSGDVFLGPPDSRMPSDAAASTSWSAVPVDLYLEFVYLEQLAVERALGAFL